MTLESLTHIFENDGLKFKKYQKKLTHVAKNKEAFESSNINIPKSQLLLNQSNVVKNAAQELKQLQTQFSTLLERYQTSNTQLMTTTNTYLNNKTSDLKTNIGQNVFVNSVINNTDDQYMGCYVDNGARAMNGTTPITGTYVTYDKCKQSAVDNGYKYFGLQNGEQCFVSNDENQIKQYGESINTTLIKLWESKTTGTGNTFLVNVDNRMLVQNSSGQILWQTPENSLGGQCWWGGNVNMGSINATYGGSFSGNATTKLVDNLYSQQRSNGKNDGGSYNITATDDLFGSQKQNCSSNLAINYQCGNKSKNVNISSGQTATIDCSKEKKSCSFYIRCQDDGNLVFCTGSVTDTNTQVLWDTKTTGQNKDPNVSWSSSKNKYGVNYMTNGQTLASGDWLSSNNGALKLIMQTDGNLVLYTSTLSTNCNSKNSNGKIIGNAWANAVYKLNNTGYPDFMGKLGFLDEKSVLTEYPKTMIPKMYEKNTAVYGYDIPTSSRTLESCTVECNNNPKCAEFVFSPVNKGCWMKSTSNTTKVPLDGYDLYYKNTLKNHKSCNKSIINIDSTQWNAYKKSNNFMTPDTKCGLTLAVQADQSSISELGSQLETMSARIIWLINYLENLDSNLIKQTGINKSSLDDMIIKYQNYNTKFSQYKNGGELKNINGILSESNIVIIHENYKYILWSILAIVCIILTFIFIKRNQSV